jgi:tubulin--tyrosine ligase
MNLVLLPSLQLVQTNKFAVISKSKKSFAHVNVFVDLNCEYSRQILLDSLARRPWCHVTNGDIDNNKSLRDAVRLNASDQMVVQFADFENIEWDSVMNGSERASSYLVRKGLSRKAQLALQLKKYGSKNPQSKLMRESIPYSIIVETWSAFDNMRLNFGGMFASFDASSTSMTLRQKFEFILEDVRDEMTKSDREDWYWILKPSVTNKGQNISLARNWDEFLDELEKEPDIREWVVQRYIPNPLLVNGHKFHFRVYVLCVGALEVFVFDRILMLIAAHKYNLENIEDIHCHLTNTARAVELDDFDEEKFVKLMTDLPAHLVKDYPHIAPDLEAGKKVQKKLLEDIHRITGEVFSAFENEYTVFAPMSNCFELYGLDFIVDEKLNVSLLEINPGPDFKQTGDLLRKVIIDMWDQTCAIIVDNEINSGDKGASDEGNHSAKDFTNVYSKLWSASSMKGGMSFKN